MSGLSYVCQVAQKALKICLYTGLGIPSGNQESVKKDRDRTTGEEPKLNYAATWDFISTTEIFRVPPKFPMGDDCLKKNYFRKHN